MFNIICEGCGYRNKLAREILTPQEVYCVCHECEISLKVEITQDLIARAVLRRAMR